MSRIKPEDQVAYYKEYPPKCVDDFLIKPAWLEHIEFDGHGFSGRHPNGLIPNLNIVFAINCQCGRSNHSIVAEYDYYASRRYENLVFVVKYYLECISCHSRHLFFDPSLHGYNAEIFRMEGLSPSDYVDPDLSSAEHETINCQCSNCNHSSFEAFARFEYSAGLFDEPEFSGKKQGLFSWFTGIGRCSICSTFNMFIDYECA